MKTLSIVLRSAAAVVFAFVMSSASCSLLDDVDDVTIDIELAQTFSIDEKKDDKNVSYTDKEILDAASVNSDFDKYKDKIQSITVTGVTYQILDHTVGTGTIFTNGVSGFSASTGSTYTKAASLGIENLKAAEGQVKNLPYDQAALDELSNLLKNDKKVAVYFAGTFSQTPVKFNVKVKVKATIVANAL